MTSVWYVENISANFDGNLYWPILHLQRVELRCKLQEKLHRGTGPLGFLMQCPDTLLFSVISHRNCEKLNKKLNANGGTSPQDVRFEMEMMPNHEMSFTNTRNSNGMRVTLSSLSYLLKFWILFKQ